MEPRKYRFRFLNAAVSRSWALYFAECDSLDGKLPFDVIASDSGLLGHPVEVSDLVRLGKTASPIPPAYHPRGSRIA